ncbi:MAG: heme exporter protein CcmD [Roseovarius sp.]|nr:heme exporter protein CcmD [Roseovarius sp.]
MLESGKYADLVLLSYAVSLLLLFALVAVSLWQSVRNRKKLEDIEKRIKRHD